MVLAETLSRKVEGHPFILHLLGGTFNDSSTSIQSFVATYEDQLLNAKNKYGEEDHRHPTLYACIDTSVRSLEAEQRKLLSGLWVFHAPFLPETAATIYGPET